MGISHIMHRHMYGCMYVFVYMLYECLHLGMYIVCIYDFVCAFVCIYVHKYIHDRHTYINVYVAGISIHPFPVEFSCFGGKILHCLISDDVITLCH